MLIQVSTTLDQLDQISNRARDPRLTQLWSQLSQAADALRGNRPMPQGIERLLEQAVRYIGRDDD